MRRIFRTTKTLSGGATSFRKWAEWSEGDWIIGKYVSTKLDQYNKPNWTYEVEDVQFAGEPGASDSLVGKRITLNSTGKLDKAMSQVAEGQIVQVTYNGKAMITGGKYAGKEAHDVQVDLVEEADGAATAKAEANDEDYF